MKEELLIRKLNERTIVSQQKNFCIAINFVLLIMDQLMIRAAVNFQQDSDRESPFTIICKRFPDCHYKMFMAPAIFLFWTL